MTTALPDDTLVLLSSHVDDRLGNSWKKATLVLNAARRYRYISKQVECSRLVVLRSTIHVVLAIDRFKKPLKQGSTPLLEKGLPHSVQEVGATDLDVLGDPLQAEEVEPVVRSLGAQESNIPRLAGDCCIEQQSPPLAMQALLSRAQVMDGPFESLSSNNINSLMLPHRFYLEHAVVTIPNDNLPPSSGGDTFDATMRGVDPMMALDNRATVSIAANPVKAAIFAAKTAFAIALLSISASILLQGGGKGSSKTRAGLILSGLFTIFLLVTAVSSSLYILMEIFILLPFGNNLPRRIRRAISVAANLCFVVSALALLTDLIVGSLSKLNSKEQTRK